MADTLINLGNVSLMSIRLQKTGNLMASDLLQRQHAQSNLLIGMSEETQRVLTNQQRQQELVSEVSNEIIRVKSAASQSLQNQARLEKGQQGLEEASERLGGKVVGMSQGIDKSLRNQQSLLTRQEQQTKRLASLGAHMTRVQDTVTKIQQGSEASLVLQKQLSAEQTKNHEAIVKVSSGINQAQKGIKESLSRHHKLEEGQKKQMNMAKETLGYLERVLSVLRALTDTLTTQSITLERLWAAFADAQLWLFLLMTGALLAAITSTKRTIGARVPVSMMWLAYWVTGDAPYIPVWLSRSSFVSLAVSLVIHRFFTFQDFSHRMDNWIVNQKTLKRQEAKFLKSKQLWLQSIEGKTTSPNSRDLTVAQACLMSLHALHTRINQVLPRPPRPPLGQQQRISPPRVEAGGESSVSSSTEKRDFSRDNGNPRINGENRVSPGFERVFEMDINIDESVSLKSLGSKPDLQPPPTTTSLREMILHPKVTRASLSFRVWGPGAQELLKGAGDAMTKKMEKQCREGLITARRSSLRKRKRPTRDTTPPSREQQVCSVGEASHEERSSRGKRGKARKEGEKTLLG